MKKDSDKSELKLELGSIKEELEDHLSSINDSSNEIENNYSYLMELDERLSSVEKKLDAVLAFAAKFEGKNLNPRPKKINLSEQEKELFMVFYTADRALSYSDLCERIGRSESYVRYYLNNLITKSIPIKKHSRRNDVNGKAFFTLDPAFKELQAKSNVLGISRTVTLDCFDQSIIKK